MKIIEKVKSLLGRGPVTDAELAARAEVEIERERTREEAAKVRWER